MVTNVSKEYIVSIFRTEVSIWISVSYMGRSTASGEQEEGVECGVISLKSTIDILTAVITPPRTSIIFG
jgi:hypothetical protein